MATLDDEAATPVEGVCGGGTPTISGTFRPNNPLLAFDGLNASGLWTLAVQDLCRRGHRNPAKLVSRYFGKRRSGTRTLHPRLDRPRPSWSRCDEASASV